MFQDQNLVATISQNHATEFTPGHAGYIDRDGEWLSHRVCCHSLCNFLSSSNTHDRAYIQDTENSRYFQYYNFLVYPNIDDYMCTCVQIQEAENQHYIQ